ncbi:hypothetical protein Bca101_082274 [Brassica carinata]
MVIFLSIEPEQNNYHERCKTLHEHNTMEKPGAPHNVRLYSIASTRYGDFFDGNNYVISLHPSTMEKLQLWGYNSHQDVVVASLLI